MSTSSANGIYTNGVRHEMLSFCSPKQAVEGTKLHISACLRGNNQVAKFVGSSI